MAHHGPNGGSRENRAKVRGRGASLRAQARRQIRRENGVGRYGEKLVPITLLRDVLRWRASKGDRQALRVLASIRLK